ncbi:MAG: nuclear transport factor 2 family protein [Bacteroidota bacterium]
MKYLLSFAILFACSTDIFAQKLDTAAVLAPIHQLFEGMMQKDSNIIKQVFHPDAQLATTYTDSLGQNHLQRQPIQEFITSIGNIPQSVQLEERLLDYEVLVDAPMATVWTPYEFYVNENFSHCGVNAFTLFLSENGWKIANIIDTRRREGCQD